MLLAILASPGAAMPLRDAVRQGLANNPEVRAAGLDVEAAETDVRVARAGYYPSVSVSAGPRNFSFSDVTYDVTAAQMVHDWGRTRSRVDSARAVERQAEAEALVRRDTAALDLAELYLDLLQTSRLVEADRRHIEHLTQVQEMTQARASGGYSDLAEPERASLELARARERLAQDEGDWQDRHNQFLLLVGEEPGILEEPVPDPAIVQDVAAGIDATVATSPAYLRASEDTRVAQATVGEARASLLPQVNVEASTLRRDIGGRAQSDTMVGLRLRMDTFQGTAAFQRAGAARQRLESARWREGAVARELKREARNIIDTMELLRDREATLLRQVESSTTLGGLYIEQFRVGRRDVIDLLNVSREAFDAERQAITVRIEQIRLHYRLGGRLGLIDRMLGLETA